VFISNTKKDCNTLDDELNTLLLFKKLYLLYKKTETKTELRSLFSCFLSHFFWGKQTFWLFLYVLNQWWANYGPRAISGPRSHFIRPASTSQFPMQQAFTLVSRLIAQYVSQWTISFISMWWRNPGCALVRDNCWYTCRKRKCVEMLRMLCLL